MPSFLKHFFSISLEAFQYFCSTFTCLRILVFLHTLHYLMVNTCDDQKLSENNALVGAVVNSSCSCKYSLFPFFPRPPPPLLVQCRGHGSHHRSLSDSLLASPTSPSAPFTPLASPVSSWPADTGHRSPDRSSARCKRVVTSLTS